MQPPANTPPSTTEGPRATPSSQNPPGVAVGNEAGQAEAPTVFISYSHDSKEHKAWVASFAQRLMENGVNVLFDQWDLGPGDDVPKFMEHAVATADRVLMVCTEAYVRKADDGKGGVGYEAMVVTGELVRDLGTNKFIPVVRQANPPALVPRCVSTRFYVDLSEGANAEEGMELLLREIHNAPKLPKPPLGKNPFAAGTFEGEEKKAAKRERRLEFSESIANPETAYERALDIIQADDRVAWRKLLLAASEQGAESLKRWTAKKPDIPPATERDFSAMFAYVQSGVDLYAPFIACLVAAAETGKQGYADQLGWVETILEPPGYDRSGPTEQATFPETVFFVAQALIGGMLMLCGAGEAAYQLATAKIPDHFGDREALPLFSRTRCNGWPETLGRRCTVAWKFLDSLISSWAWLKRAYGSERESRSGIAAYYQVLSFLNFVKLAKDGRLEVPGKYGGALPVTAPLSFSVWDADIVTAGYRCFLKQGPIVRRILEANQLNQAEFQGAWEKWMAIVESWLGNVHPYIWLETQVPQRDLPKDLRASPYSLA